MRFIFYIQNYDKVFKSKKSDFLMCPYLDIYHLIVQKMSVITFFVTFNILYFVL
jgi:hypothetical protein